MVLSIVVSGRYLVWRFTSTLDFDGALQTVLVLALAVGEIYTTIRVGFTYFSWHGRCAGRFTPCRKMKAHGLLSMSMCPPITRISRSSAPRCWGA